MPSPSRVLAVLAAVALLAAGCGSASKATPAPAARLTVVASNVPLAQLAASVGGDRVTVTDLSQGAPDDRTVTPTAAQVSQLHAAALVVDVGDGYQPHVEAVAGSAPGVLRLAPALGAGTPPQFWLDPPTMGRAASLVAAALGHLDPAGAGPYHQGATDVTDQMSSLQIEVQSDLADCPHTLVVAPDDAFGPLARGASLKLVAVPEGASTTAASNQIRATSLPTLFSEPPVADTTLAALARSDHVALHALDTMDGPPPDPRLATASYLSRMEQNLHVLAGGLYCTSGGNG